MAKEQKRPSSLSRSPRESSPQAYKLGSRSCQGCYQRKIRCDRGVPCANCSRHGASCVYAAKGGTDGTRNAPNLQNIANRLGRLEVLLSRLLERSELASESTPASGSSHDRVLEKTQRRGPSTANANTNTNAAETTSQQTPNTSTWEILLNDERDEETIPFTNNPSIERIHQAGDTRSQESPVSDATSPLHFQHNTTAAAPYERHGRSDSRVILHHDVPNVQEFYPNTQLALQLWSVYVKSVDPVVKILHIPTLQSTVVATILDPKSAPSSTLALTFAIYYAAVTTLCHGEGDDDGPIVDLPYDKRTLVGRFKTALDRLLTVANLVNRPEIASIQALAIYITCLRVHEVGRSVWILNGLAIRLAQSMGLHQDGARLKLSPFETEMRLRLWWHLCVLDSRAPEDQGLQPTISVTNAELRLPLNVNDTQLYPDMACLPTESGGWTDMSFFLVQTQACRRMHPLLETQERERYSYSYSYASDSLLPPIEDIGELRRAIRNPAQYMLETFGVSLRTQTAATDARNPQLSRLAMQHMCTACKKMEFVLQLREEKMIARTRTKSTEQHDAAGAAATAPDILKLSFQLACGVLESSRALLKDGSLPPKFRWFFNMYTQWYALAYVMRYLCTSSPWGPEKEHAWTLVEELFPSGLGLHGYDGGSIWSYLHRLRHQTSLLREQHAHAATGEVSALPHGRHGTPELLEARTLLPTDGITEPNEILNGISMPVDPSQELVANSNQNMFSSLDLFMADIPFLPDWDTVINM